MSPYRTPAPPPLLHFARLYTIPICSYGLPWHARLRLWLYDVRGEPVRVPRQVRRDE